MCSSDLETQGEHQRGGTGLANHLLELNGVGTLPDHQPAQRFPSRPMQRVEFPAIRLPGKQDQKVPWNIHDPGTVVSEPWFAALVFAASRNAISSTVSDGSTGDFLSLKNSTMRLSNSR